MRKSKRNTKAYGIIYGATNKINGKKYVGKTTRILEYRKIIHERCRDSKKVNLFQKAIKKYGEHNFIWDILIYCNSDEELNDFEKHYIEFFKATNKKHGYNLTKGGTGGALVGKALKDMGNSQKDNWKSKEYRDKMLKSGNCFINPHLEISSKGGKNSWKNASEKRHEEAAARTKERFKNNPKQLEKFLLSSKTPEAREKQAKTFKEIWKKEEHRNKVKNSVDKYWSDPENHKKASERLKRSWITRRKNALCSNI